MSIDTCMNAVFKVHIPEKNKQKKLYIWLGLNAGELIASTGLPIL